MREVSHEYYRLLYSAKWHCEEWLKQLDRFTLKRVVFIQQELYVVDALLTSHYTREPDIVALLWAMVAHVDALPAVDSSCVMETYQREARVTICKQYLVRVERVCHD